MSKSNRLRCSVLLLDQSVLNQAMAGLGQVAAIPLVAPIAALPLTTPQILVLMRSPEGQ